MWRALDGDRAKTLLDFLQTTTLAYRQVWWTAAEAWRRSLGVLDALGDSRAWACSELYMIIDPVTLALPDRGYGISGHPLLTNATFEESVVLVSRTHVVVLVWTAED